MTNQSHNLIAEFIRAHPDRTWQEVASIFAVSMSTISRVAKEAGLSRPAGLDEAAIASRVNHGGDERSE